MRSDMGRVVIEKERRGSRNLGRKIRTFGKVVMEEDGPEYYGPTRISSSRRRQFGWNCKEPTDVLNPLNGYLRKNIGRPWDEVWSEMCSVLRKGGVGVSHILEAHVEVMRDCFLGNYQQVGRYGYSPSPEPILFGTRMGGNSVVSVGDDFYVDENGLLAKGERVHTHAYWRNLRSQKATQEIRVQTDGDKWYVKVKGLWFLGTYHSGCTGLCSYPRNIGEPRRTIKGAIYSYTPVWPDVEGQHFHCIKSCSKREIKDAKRRLSLQ